MTTIDIPIKISQIGDHAFEGCKNLQSVEFHNHADTVGEGNDEITQTNLTIGSYVFSGCEKLKKIILSDNVTYLKVFAFSGTEFNSITIPKSVEGCGYSRNTGWEYYGPLAGASKLTEVIFEDGIKKIPPYFCSSSDYIINRLTNITKVLIPSTVEEIGGGAFYRCDHMTIYGYKNTYAETYAREHNIPFKEASKFNEDSVEINEYSNIVGKLQEVDASNSIIIIDDKEYHTSSYFDYSNANNILKNHANKIVIARAMNDYITKVEDVKDILTPEIKIQPAVDNIQYENGKYKKSSFKVKVKVECGVNEPYSLPDISSVIDKIDGLSINVGKIAISSSLSNGSIPFLFKDSLFDIQDTTFEKELNVKLKPGDSKEADFTAHMNGIVPEYVNNDAKITVSVDGKEISKSRATVHISNMDLAEKEEQKKELQ